MTKSERIASLERQVKYLNEQMQRICDCRWAPFDGPRLDTSPHCLIHRAKLPRVIDTSSTTVRCTCNGLGHCLIHDATITYGSELS